MRFHARAPPALSHTRTHTQSARRVNRTYDNAHLNVRNVTPAPSGPWGPRHGTGPGVRGALAVEYHTHRAQLDGVRGAGLRDRPVTDAWPSGTS